MTKPRYYRLQEIAIEKFALDAPVEIEKGALLLDKQTKTVILQIKLNILIDDFNKISSVTIKINGYDDAGDEIQGFSPHFYKFRYVNLIREKSLGEKTPIILAPDVRKVKVDIERVVFTNGAVWQNHDEKIEPQKQRAIKGLENDLQAQLNRDIKGQTIKGNEQIKYFPQQLDKYWLCSCGRPNKNETVKCCRCGISKNWVFEYVNEENIQKNLKQYQEDLRIEEEKKRIKEKEAKALRGKRNRRIRNASLITLGVGILVVLFIYVLFPLINYSRATSYMSNGDFDKALVIFKSLDDYRDSEKMKNETSYQIANDYLINNNYDEAIHIFDALADYKNSKELLNETKYQKANDYLINEQYDEAIAIFEIIANYKNSKELLNETYYQKAKDLIADKQYAEAEEILNNLGDYRNNNELRQEIEYNKAIKFLTKSNYELAISIFTDLGEYKDSDNLILEAKYEKAKKDLSNGKYDLAIQLLEDMEEYEGSEELLKEAYYQKAFSFYESKQYAEAMNIFSDLDNYKESEKFKNEILDVYEVRYLRGIAFFENRAYDSALPNFASVKDYKDSKLYISKINLINKLVDGFWNTTLKSLSVSYRTVHIYSITGTSIDFPFIPEFDPDNNLIFRGNNQMFVFNGDYIKNETTGLIYW